MLIATLALTRVANRMHLRQLRIAHCTGCGTTVRADHVLGLIGFHVAHAECSLARAGTPDVGQPLVPAAAPGSGTSRAQASSSA